MPQCAVNVGSRFLCLFGSVLLSAAALAQPPPFTRTPHLADYDAELRRPDGRVDTEAMLQRLKDLHVTTYYWLILHAATDWDDLQLFLPKAAKAHIDVWVYIVPPTEGPPHYPASEPFRLDYSRWAEEIAGLSLEHHNLTGWIIDDFYANHKLFTPEYTRQLRERAKAINPQLAFLPLMYFPEISPDFVESYRDAIDGVVVAYPQDRDEINNARAVLEGESVAKPGEAGFGAAVKKSKPRFHIPFILMTAASTNEFKLRHGEPANPERIAGWLRLCLHAWNEGQCDGVVTYCVDKKPDSPVFPLMRQAFGEFREGK
jgi:hypothetical protein